MVCAAEAFVATGDLLWAAVGRRTGRTTWLKVSVGGLGNQHGLRFRLLGWVLPPPSDSPY